MKKILSIILSLSISIVLFMSCSNDSTPPVLPIIPPVSPTSLTAPVTFDFSNAKAIAHMGESSSRSAADSEEYVKILTDGTFEAAIKLTGTGSLAKVVGIYPSKTNSGDVYVAFQENSNLYSGFTPQSIGQLICVHSDGTFDDILKVGNNSNYYTNYLSLETKSVTFDKNGNVYFFATAQYDSNGNWISNAGQQIYQYKPTEKQLNKLVAAVDGTSYEKIQISEDSSLIFAQGRRYNNSTTTYFLRAIPVADAGNFVNICYGNNYIDPRYSNWVYDDRNGKFFYYGAVGNVTGLHTFTRAENFNNDTIVAINAASAVPILFQKYFSNNINTNELLEKLSMIFRRTIKIVVYQTSYSNSNGGTTQLFTELGNTEYENAEALSWLKSEISRKTAFLDYIEEWLNANNYSCAFLKYQDNPSYNYWSGICPWYTSIGFTNLSVNANGLYSWEASGNSIVLVHITDENGNYLYDVVNKTLPVTGKIVETTQHGTKIFMKYSLTNSSNVELGYHHIYSVDFQNNTLSNYFDAFTNKNTMEVVSYSVGADNLYFSFVNGLNVENYVIDLNTNNARRLETNRKMIDVFAF